MKPFKLWSVLLVAVMLLGCSVDPTPTAVVQAPKIPDATGYVMDTIGLLDAGTVDQLTAFCKSVEPKLQLAVLIVNSTQPYSIEQYGIKVGDAWKVGYKGKDNGVIVILAKTDRKVRIEVGRGAESFLPDAKAGQIINTVIIPRFKQGDWSGGLVEGLKAINKEVKP